MAVKKDNTPYARRYHVTVAGALSKFIDEQCSDYSCKPQEFIRRLISDEKKRNENSRTPSSGRS